jgi:antirestriction protein ArdC
MELKNSSPHPLDVYAMVTGRIIELLNVGTVPWQRPWREAGMPANLISKRPYRGINIWLLLSLNYSRHLYLTWDQLKKLGGSVKQGEHGHVIVFWGSVEGVEDDSKKTPKKHIPILRYYKVFNVEQCTNLRESLI